MSAHKSSVEEIRTRFDNDVERFSNLETGQSATVDAPLAMNLVCDAAAACTPQARQVLDIGCGAGNYSLKLLQKLPGLDVTLVDLSQPMLDRAEARVSEATSGKVESVQADIREFNSAEEHYDIVLAAAVLHHLRTDEEWTAVFQQIYNWLRPGGSFWIFDLITSNSEQLEALMQSHYSDYLVSFKDESYRDLVFEYIAAEDSPRPLMEQLTLLQQVGFSGVDVLHKNSCFAAFGGWKA